MAIAKGFRTLQMVASPELLAADFDEELHPPSQWLAISAPVPTVACFKKFLLFMV